MPEVLPPEPAPAPFPTAADIARQLGAVLGGLIAQIPHAPACYSSKSLPPGYTSKKAFAHACRMGRVPGAHRRGRIWLVTAEDFHRKTEIVVPKLVRGERPSADPVQRALASLAAKGLVAVREGEG